MEVKNKYGLSRSIDQNTKRLIRQECGFGCVVCGAAIYQYEHIDPEFKDAKTHDKNCIALLCASCHFNVTKGLWSKSKIFRHRASPFCLNSKESKWGFDLDPSKDLIIKFGKLKFINVKRIIEIDEKLILSIESPGVKNSPPILNAIFFDRADHEIARIEQNEWIGSADSFDIESIANRIIVKSAVNNIDLELFVNHPNIIEISRINLLHNGKSIRGSSEMGFTVRTEKSSLILGQVDKHYNVVPFGISVKGSKIYVGEPIVTKYIDIDGTESELDGFYEVDGAELAIMPGGSGPTPKLRIKTNKAGGGIGIKFNLPEVGLSRVHLRFYKQQRNDVCDCGSGKKIKRCCQINRFKFEEIFNNSSIRNMFSSIVTKFGIDEITYKFVFRPNVAPIVIDLNKINPTLLINSSKIFTLENLVYILYFWILIKEGYLYYHKDMYGDQKDAVLKEISEVLLSIPILERVEKSGIDMHRYFKSEFETIVRIMNKKRQTDQDLRISGESLLGSIKLLRLTYNTNFVTRDEKNRVFEMFRVKSPLAYDLNKNLLSIMKEHDLYTMAGHNSCLIDCIKMFNNKAQGRFNDALILLNTMEKNFSSSIVKPEIQDK